MQPVPTIRELDPATSKLSRSRRRVRTPCEPTGSGTDHFSPPRAMRCACQACGAHTIATVGYKVAGNCPNCGSYELSPVID